MTKQLSDLKKGTDAFYKKVGSHMKTVKRVSKGKNKRESNAINDWFYGKMCAQKPLVREFKKVLHDNLLDLYEE